MYGIGSIKIITTANINLKSTLNSSGFNIYDIEEYKEVYEFISNKICEETEKSLL